MKAAQYDKQMPFSGNAVQYNLVTDLASNPRVESKAQVARTALNLLFDLTRDEEVPEGADRDAVLALGLERLRYPERFKVVRVETEPSIEPVA